MKDGLQMVIIFSIDFDKQIVFFVCIMTFHNLGYLCQCVYDGI